MLYDEPPDRRVALGDVAFDPYEPQRDAESLFVRESHKGFYSRGYLPHIDVPRLQFVTFRLYDSFPAHLLDGWRAELDELGDDERRREGYRRTESYVDAGHGACWLRRSDIAEVVERQLLFHDGDRYALRAWTLMPNHIHLLAEIFPGQSLPKVVQSWKARSARTSNERLGRTGPFWYRDYCHRYVRDEAHLANCVSYIDRNPVKVGLCAIPEEWAWGSARSILNGQEAPSATRRSQGVSP